MTLRRPWGIRTQLVAVTVGIAVTAVLIATLSSAIAVDSAVERFGRMDLQLSAEHTAAVAGFFYGRDGRRWTPGAVREIARLESVEGHIVVVRDRRGHVVPGSAAQQAPQRALAPVIVGGRRVGSISLAHRGGGYLRVLSKELHQALQRNYVVAGLTAAALGVLVAVVLAFALSGPVRRLTAAAARIESGDLDTPIEADRGAAELRQLGRMIERVVETLKREDAIRRETISDLAHELRTPMAGLRGRIEAAQDGVLTDMPALLESMHADVLRLGRLMEDVEHLAAAQQPGLLLDHQEVDLAQLARSRARAFEDYYRAAGISFLADIEPVSTTGDAERLGQVIDNLLSNALRYTDKGGRVILRVLSARTHAIIEVADTGVGIAPEELPRIFDRFWRAEKSRSRATGGAGLGLALVHELVRAHDGRVEVESMPGRGSRFRVHLPIAGGEESRALVELHERDELRAGDGTPVVVGRLTREAGAGDWRAVERLLLRRVREGLRLLVFELEGHTVLEPQAVSTLMSVRAQLEGRGGRLVVVCMEGTRGRKDLQATGVDRVLTVASDQRSALAALVEGAAGAPIGDSPAPPAAGPLETTTPSAQRE